MPSPENPAKKDSEQQKKTKLQALLENDWLYIGILVLLAIILFRSFIFSNQMLFGSDTVAGLDARVFFREALRIGQFPLWFNSRLGGMPTVDAMFGDAMYLPSLLVHWLFPVYRALGLKLVLHVFLAGVFFYLFLCRGFGISRPVSMVGALLYMLNPEFVSNVYPGHDGKMFVIAWLPYIAWRMKVLMENPKLVNTALLGLGIGMSLFTSHIQMTYFTLWGLFLYWVFTLVLLWRDKKSVKALLPQGIYFWVAVAAGVGIAFIQFFPSFMYVRDAYSVRGVERGFEYAASWSLHWPEFFSLWIPEFGNTLQGYWGENPFKLNTEYAGAIVLLFAVMAVAFRPRPWRFFWAGLAILAVGYGMGKHSPVFHLAYYLVPGVRKFRAASMIMFWFSFAVVALASFFFNDIWRGRFDDLTEEQRTKRSKALLIAGAAITGITLLFLNEGFTRGFIGIFTPILEDTQKNRIFSMNFSENFKPNLLRWWLFAITSIGLLWGVINKKVNKGVFLTIVAIIGIYDCMRVDSLFIQTEHPGKYFSSDPALEQLASEMKESPFRIYTLPGVFRQNNAAGIHHLEGVGDFHDNELQWYREFRGDQNNRNYISTLIKTGADGRQYLAAENLEKGNPFLDIANVRYLIAAQNGRIIPITNRNAFGRLSFASTYKVFGENEIVPAMQNGSYDYRSTVALMEEPAEKVIQDLKATKDNEGSAPSIKVSWQKYTPNYRKASIEVDRDGFLRIAEVWYPAWEIRIDGKPVKIYRSDFAWMATSVSKGSHVVEMLPHSEFLGTASMVSLPVMAGMIIVFAFAIRRRKVKTPVFANKTGENAA